VLGIDGKRTPIFFSFFLLKKERNNPLPKRLLGSNVGLITLCGNEATSVKISILSSDHRGTLSELVTKEQHGREYPREPSTEQILGIGVTLLSVSYGITKLNSCVWNSRGDGQVASSNNASDTNEGSNDVTIWVSPRNVWEIGDSATLLLPAVTETEVKEENQNPRLENDGTDDRDEPVEDNTGTNKDGDQGNAGEKSDDGQSENWDTTCVDISDSLGCPTVTRKGEQHTSGNIKVRVGGRED